MSIQRYDIDEKLAARFSGAVQATKDGQYVEFNAHKAIVAEMQAEIDRLKGVNEVLMRERNFDPGAANVLSGFIAERNRWMTECDRLKALCEWRPITADDLPKVGDEVLEISGTVQAVGYPDFIGSKIENGFDLIASRQDGWSYVRPINAPVQP